MEVIVIGSRGFPDVQGGIESHCEELYPRLVKKGYKVIALVIGQYPQKNWKGISFIRIPTLPLKNLQKFVYNTFSAMYCIIKRPDIIHIHGLNAGFYIWLFKLLGLKVIATYHSMDYIYPKWNRFIKKCLRFSEKQFLLADYIITISKPYLRHFIKIGRNNSICYLPNGVNLRADRHDLYENNNILSKWNLQKYRYILTVGRITPEKDIMTLIKAFEKAKINGMKLVIAGGWEFHSKYLESLKSVSSNNVIFTGQLKKSDLYVLYLYCSLFVLCSIYEGLPISLLEAMSFNCNILLSDIEVHKEVGLGEDSYFKTQDIEDLSNKIRHKISNNKKKDYSQFLLKNYNWESIADEVDKIYRIIICK